jgi:hypothetical protein
MQTTQYGISKENEPMRVVNMAAILGASLTIMARSILNPTVMKKNPNSSPLKGAISASI